MTYIQTSRDLSTPYHCNNDRVFYTLYMTQYKTHCACGERLLVPTWRKCNACTNASRKPKVYLKGPYKKAGNPDWFEHNGYLVKIPLIKYHFAEGLLYDYENREIIGWF